jgi:hypothetical protein
VQRGGRVTLLRERPNDALHAREVTRHARGPAPRWAGDRGAMIPAMLRSVLRNLLPSRDRAPARVAPPTADADGAAQRFEAAAAAWRAGRTAEALALCRALLEDFPDHSLAHALISAAELSGERYIEVLDRIHQHLRPRSYLEIGVAAGDSIRLARPGTRAIGVDPEPKIAAPLGDNVRIFATTSDEFFASHDVAAELGGLPIDLAFIDGMHRFEFALRDFVNIEARCAPGATVLIHDTYPLDPRTAARERTTTFWSGDVWRLVLLLRAHRPDLALHTIAAPPTGLTLVRNLSPGATYLRDHLDALVEEYLALDFGVLARNKAEQLALFPNDWPRIRALLEPAA